MREYIVEQMKQGRTLEDIHIAVERMFNEEYNKREREQKLKETVAVRERAVHAVMDYITALGGKADHIGVTIALDELAAGFVDEEDDDEVVVKAYKNGKETDVDEALMNFLVDMGLAIKVK